MIRAVRPTDVVALAAFQSQACVVELAAPVWPYVPAGPGRLMLVSLLAEALLSPAPRRRAWLASRHGSIEGLVIARIRAGGAVWVVERLAVAASAPATGERLLEHVSARATAHGARRVFHHAPLEPAAQAVALRAGFRRFTGSLLYRLAGPLPRAARPTYLPRPRLSSDDHRLFKLYNQAVPLNVRSAEAMTREEWAMLHHGSRGWSNNFFGVHEEYVWQTGDDLMAWATRRADRRSQHCTLLVHPNFHPMVESLLHFLVNLASDRMPLYATAREYQPEVASALERLSFRLVGESEVWVRQLASRVSEPRLVPANVAGRC